MRIVDWLRAAPPGVSLIWEPGALAKAMEGAGEPEKRVTWVPLRAAADIAGLSEHTLRKRCPSYLRMHERGEIPPIRVLKNGDKPGSPWLCAQEDCYAYRRTHGGGPRLAPAPQPADDSDEALIAHFEKMAITPVDSCSGDTRRAGKASTA